MTAQSKTVIKSYFQTGDYPTESQFIDLIDSYQDINTLSNYYVDGGITANVYSITTSPVTSTYTAGMSFAVKISNTNNGASTLNAGGGALSILYLDGTALNPGALVSGGIALFYTDTINWYLVNVVPGASGGGITSLTGAVIASGSGAVTATIAPGGINLTTDVTGDLPLSNLAQFAANTVACNPTASTADLSTVTLAASQLMGRGSTGNLAAIILDSTLTMSGATLSVTGGGAGTAATQAQQEAGSSTTVFTSPGRQQFHPSAAKFWAYVTVSGGVPTLVTSYNVTSITDAGVGQLTVTIATDFSTANWAGVLGTSDTGSNSRTLEITSKASGSVGIQCIASGGGTSDALDAYNVAGFGDQ